MHKITVIVEGQYYAAAKTRKSYQESFILDKPMLASEARSLIRRQLLSDRLKKRHKDDFLGIYSCSVVDIVSDDNSKSELPSSFEQMTKTNLVEFIRQEELPVDIKEYRTVSELRSAARLAFENPQAFLEKKDLDIKRGKVTASRREKLEELNQEIEREIIEKI